MLKKSATFPLGIWILTLWTLFQLTLASIILVSMIFLHKNAPGAYLILDESTVKNLSPSVLHTINGMAVLLNASFVSLCLCSLLLIWKGIAKRILWTFWTVAISLLFLQIFGFVSDAYFYHQNLAFNILSTGILILGFTLSYKNLSKKD